MIATKFGIGQQVRHRLSGVPGVIVDVDPEYSLDTPRLDEVGAAETLRTAPWYQVVMEDEEGDQVHTYIDEIQLSGETSSEQPEMDELAASIHQQLQAPACATIYYRRH